MKKVLVLGPNPAWQHTLFFDHFVPGDVNRVTEVVGFVGGKGGNLLRALRNWGKLDGTLLQFAGGDMGRKIDAELRAEHLNLETVWTSTASRTCITCLDRGGYPMTELIEPSFTVSPEEAEEFRQKICQLAPTADVVACCGTLPGKTPSLLYASAAEAAEKANALLYLDICNELDVILKNRKLHPHLKINTKELFQLTNCTDGNICRSMSLLAERYSLDVLAVTAGAENAYLYSAGNFFQFTIPANTVKVVTTLGCGDTAGAVYLSEFLSGLSPEEAFRFGLAAACANCCSWKCAEFSLPLTEEIAEKIIVERL